MLRSSRSGRSSDTPPRPSRRGTGDDPQNQDQPNTTAPQRPQISQSQPGIPLPTGLGNGSPTGGSIPLTPSATARTAQNTASNAPQLQQQQQPYQQHLGLSASSSTSPSALDPDQQFQHPRQAPPKPGRRGPAHFDELSHLQTQQYQQQQQQQSPPPLGPLHDYSLQQQGPQQSSGHASPQSAINPQLQLQQPTGPLHPADPNNPVASAAGFESPSQFVDSVTRSQSHRYIQLQQQQQQPPSINNSSLEDIPRTLVQPFIVSPLLPQGQQGQQAQVSPHLQHPSLQRGAPLQVQDVAAPPPPQPPQAQKQSVGRKLIKSLIGRTQGHKNTDQNTHSTTAGLGRKSSTRNPLAGAISPPASLRTGPSQVSLDQPPPTADWPGQQQQQQQQQPSPLQPVGDFTVDDHFDSSTDLISNKDLAFQQKIQQVPSSSSSIRPITTDSEGYQEDPRYHRLQQPPYGQGVGDTSDSKHPFHSQQQGQYAPPLVAGAQPQFLGQLSTSQLQNPETISQLSHDSPLADQDQTPNNQSSPGAQGANPNNIPAFQQQQSAQGTQGTQGTMPSTQGGPRRQDMEEAMRQAADVPPPHGPPPVYRQHSRTAGNNMNPLPPTPSNNSGSTSNFARQEQRFQEEQAQGQPQPQPPQAQHRGVEHGRDSPQPASAEQLSQADKEMKELVTKYKNVKRLYFDGKSTIEQLNAQVEQLQNAVANQRMSQSRTMLDDNEYLKLFDRLNGAMNNLSFNIRKDWRSLPSWIEGYVSPDALKTGKQEMTAVGRAVMAFWIMEEIFNKCFHPALDPLLSSSLKEIELNIRRFTYTMHMQEEQNALTNKIVSWRMATLEGLDRKLNSPGASEHYAAFTAMATTNLTAYLFQYLVEPPPPGIEGSVSMIVELAVKIAASIPMESRDISITYPMPETHFHKDVMELEKTPLPPLPDSGDDSASMGAEDAKDGKGRTKPAGPPPKDPNKIRMSGFVSVEVRGKHHLVKAPVWMLA